MDSRSGGLGSLLLSKCEVSCSDDPKLQEVLDRNPDAAGLLERFVNLPIDPIVGPTLTPGTDLKRSIRELTSDYVPRRNPSPEVLRAAEEFRSLYGELWPGYEPSDYCELVPVFRLYWTAKTQKRKKELSDWFEKLLKNQIRPARLAEAPLPDSPLMKVNTEVGTVELPIATVVEMVSSRGAVRFAPRSLLDYLVIWLVKFGRQRKLAFCELPGCASPYYVKMHPRYRYCSTACGDEARSKRHSKWWRDNRSPAAQRTSTRKTGQSSPLKSR